MVINVQSRWLVRLVSLAFWAMAAASLVWWGLRLWGDPSPAMSMIQAPVVTSMPVTDASALARLLGAAAPAGPAAAPAAISRFVLLGVVASPSKRGTALIAVDGKPGRAFRVGSKVDEGIVLEAVEPRKARLAQVAGVGEPMVLEMPLPKR